jgi:phosphoenolpyruvate carboxykinase (ATP)
MRISGYAPSEFGLHEHGFRNLNASYWNLGAAELLEHALRANEGQLALGGALAVQTGQFTGW